ncbi:Uncharacterised protein [Chryseobacterium taklimakanense]|jgi:hypothetical protein|uniref:DUF4252 domain-containing protein n=1 Tax=Chryseobacterium taklimakanense TaxID=536441 RepID=A0A239WS63_9FLAO|nr:hypothetical protein [Chryseobacterium taklimakanense]SNV37425.1 Uncharacterised protein [Chryseobacterium taklimakanense]
MKNAVLAAIIFTAASTANAKAQSIFDKIDRLAGKVESATYKVDRAANAADRAGKTGGKLAGMLGKKKENSTASLTDTNGANKTVITVSGMEMEKLQKLNDLLENTDGVTSSKMKYSSGRSTITVIHQGDTQNLMRKINAKANGVYTSQNITEMEDGLVTLKL